METTREQLQGQAGYVASSRAQETGTQVVTYEAEPQGLDVGEEHRYVTVCQPHGNMVASSSMRRARADRAHPTAWCPDCRGSEHLRRMARAWDLVRDREDWRAAVDAVVTRQQLAEARVSLEDVRQAVVHYTATTPTVNWVADTSDAWHVWALGYRMGPAGP